MGKINRIWRFILLIVGIFIVMLLVWFLVKLTFKVNLTSQVTTGINVLSEVDMTGTVKMVDSNLLVLGSVDNSDIEIKLDENSKYELRNPRNFLYEEANKDIVTKDKLIYVELQSDQEERVAKTIKTDYQTVLGGKVKSIEGNRVVYVDYQGQEMFTDLYDGTKIFKLGREDLLAVSDIPLENNIIVYSGQVYQPGQPFVAEWLEILDDGLINQDYVSDVQS